MRVALLGRGGRDAGRRAGWVAVGVSGVWLVVALAYLVVEGVDTRREGHHREFADAWYEDSGVLLLLVLVGVPVLTWISAHLVVGLCLLRGQTWARKVAIGAFAVSGLLPLWLLPGYAIGFVNAVLCGAVVFAAWRR